MKKRMSILLGSLVLVGGATLAMAANHGDEDNYMGKHGGWGKHQGEECQSSRHEKSSQKMLEHLDRKLDLSDDQRVQIEKLIEQKHAQRKASREQREPFRAQFKDLDPGSADYQDKVKALAAKHAEQVRQRLVEKGQHYADMYAILTPEQQQKFSQLREKWSGKHHSYKGKH